MKKRGFLGLLLDFILVIFIRRPVVNLDTY